MPGTGFQPRPPSKQRERFILGLQLAAAMMMAQQIGGKAARDGLFLLHFGPRALPAMIAGAAAFSVVLSLVNGRLLTRIVPRLMLPWAFGLSGAAQIVEWWLLGIRPELAVVLIYLHMAGLGVILLSSFWSMLNEEFDPREAKRRFGQIAAGGTIGGLVGGLAAERTVAWFGAPALMLGLGGLHLLCSGFLTFLTRSSGATLSRIETVPQEQGGHSAIPRSALLTTLAGTVLLGSIGVALLDYVFKVYATESFGRGHDLLRFFAFFHTGVSLLSFVFQSFGTKLFLEKFGLGVTVSALPATLLGGSVVSLVAPGMVVLAAARAVEAAVRGSLFRAGYETCYTPVPASEKRLAKSFIDVASERGGDALGAGIVMLCLKLADHSAPSWILGIASLVGVGSLILCSSLHRTYVQALARSLVKREVQLNPDDSDLDLTTRSLVMQSAIIPVSVRQTQPEGTKSPVQEDPVLKKLQELRSSDPFIVQYALGTCNVADPLIATQVCLLLGRNEYAVLANTLLQKSAGQVLGQLTDMMANPELSVSVRRRIPRIIGSVPGQRAADALLAGLEDSRFEVRMQCSRALAKAASRVPRPVISTQMVMAAVDRELSIGKVLWESHRRQQEDPSAFGVECLDDLLADKAHGSLEYVFTLLSLIHERTPLMAAFRSLHVEDNHLRGTALEYLEGILPVNTREMLWEIIQERPSKAPDREAGKVMEELMSSSETVILRLRDLRTPQD
jgi:hypothetical protein